MRHARSFPLALAGLLLLLAAPLASAGARAVDVTPVLPARAFSSHLFAPDSAAPPESTTFVQFISICPAKRCDSGGPICPDDSMRVEVAGSLPSSCFSIRRVELYYPPIMSIRPFAPWVRVIVDDGACLDQVCVPGRYPWAATITMPPLPEGPYSLDVAVQRVSCTDSVPPPPSPRYSMAFAVANCDSTPPPPSACLLGTWRHLNTLPTCDANVGPGTPGQVVFLLHSTTPIDGLQGNLVLDPPALSIAAIEPTGDAYGYRLAWTRTETGARFVLFNDAGNSIPGDSLPSEARPILLVTVAATPGVPVPAETRLFASNLTGSDPNGGLVPECPVRIAPPFARICGLADCDANHDSQTDVRDLVLMVNCLRGGAACSTTFDCNRDGSFTLDDILCCAWRILSVRPCALPGGCGPDSTPAVPPRQDATVRVTAGLPVEVAGEVRVPIHIDGTSHLGAARLAMNFPADKWHIAGFEGGDASWLTLAGEQDGQVVMGVIKIGDGSPPAGLAQLDLTLRLTPVGAAPAGGELGALTADLSGTDGVRLISPVLGPVRPLPGNPVIELSENRPDPFSGVTRFTLSLPVAATVELSVYDLGGRRVATLHHGALAAGVSEFQWDGRNDGGRLGAGVYFYRAIVGGRTYSRRMVYLGGN